MQHFNWLIVYENQFVLCVHIWRLWIKTMNRFSCVLQITVAENPTTNLKLLNNFWRFYTKICELNELISRLIHQTSVWLCVALHLYQRRSSLFICHWLLFLRYWSLNKTKQNIAFSFQLCFFRTRKTIRKICHSVNLKMFYVRMYCWCERKQNTTTTEFNYAIIVDKMQEPTENIKKEKMCNIKIQFEWWKAINVCTLWCKYPFGFEERKTANNVLFFFTLFSLSLFNDDPTQSRTYPIHPAQTRPDLRASNRSQIITVIQKFQSIWKCACFSVLVSAVRSAFEILALTKIKIHSHVCKASVFYEKAQTKF